MAQDTPRESCSVREAGRRGGEATASKYGPEFFVRNGRRGGQKVRALIEAGKRALAGDEGNEAEKAE